MKVCLFLQRNYAMVGDALAANLKETYGIEEFCGYVQTRPALRYLQNEGLVKYTALILDEDIHKRYKGEVIDIEYLKNLETKYGIPNLWPYLASDRVLMYGQGVREYPHDTPPYSHEDMLRILQVTGKAIESFLDAEKPDVVVFSVVGAVSSMLLHTIATARGIQVLTLFPALFENRYVLSTRTDRADLPHDLGTKWEKPAGGEAMAKAREFLASFRDKPRPYIDELSPDRQAVHRGKQLNFLRPNRWANTVGGLTREISRYWSDENRDDFTNVPPSHYILDRARRKVRNLKNLHKYYDAPVAGEKFAFFPLQVEPEIALLVSAPLATDQAYFARQIARSLPVGWKLYVKEHPQMAEYRPHDFYERLKKIPNVRLIDPAVKSFGLTKDCGLVVTITGSVGFEACMFGKPVITLGEHLINDLSFVKHCPDFNDLPNAVRELLKDFKSNEDELVHHIAKTIENSVSVDLTDLWYREHSKNDRKERTAPIAEHIWRNLKGAESHN